MPKGDELPRSISYIPYGEIFVEESDNKGVPPYRFNTKELDEETGLYYYGARYLDPTGVGWLSVDPLFEKYVGMSPYGYCAGNPVRLVDVDGRNPVFNEEGDLIGVTEDTGLQGDAFFMDNDSYNHKMGKAEAQEKDKGESFLNSEEEIYIYGEKKLKPILPWLK